MDDENDARNAGRAVNLWWFRSLPVLATWRRQLVLTFWSGWAVTRSRQIDDRARVADHFDALTPIA